MRGPSTRSPDTTPTADDYHQQYLSDFQEPIRLLQSRAQRIDLPRRRRACAIGGTLGLTTDRPRPLVRVEAILSDVRFIGSADRRVSNIRGSSLLLFSAVRVGVYVDGYNLYYGGRGLCGRGTPGWRWLDIRSLAASLVAGRANWQGATIHQVTYCTALIDAATNPSGYADQDVYIKALSTNGIVDVVELGYYVSRVKQAPLAIRAPGAAGLPRIVTADWPVMVLAAQGAPSRNHLAGALRGQASDGVGRHWWRQLTAADLQRHQLPDPAGTYFRPPGW